MDQIPYAVITWAVSIVLSAISAIIAMAVRWEKMRSEIENKLSKDEHSRICIAVKESVKGDLREIRGDIKGEFKNVYDRLDDTRMLLGEIHGIVKSLGK